MRKLSLAIGLAFFSLLGVSSLGACGSDDNNDEGTGGTGGIPENTGSQCAAPADCYKDVKKDADGATVHGTIECLTQVNGGYCTHTCTQDSDCCAPDVPGECKTGLKQVCAPFESTGIKHCFLSCEPGDVVAVDGGPVPSDSEYCQQNASPDFDCRSTGGGNENRKVCMPVDCGFGEACVDDTVCAAGLTCVTDTVKGGICTKTCSLSADCGDLNTACVKHGDTGYCLRKCDPSSTAYICGQCRPYDVAATCTDQVTYTESGTTGSVCVPPEK